MLVSSDTHGDTPADQCALSFGLPRHQGYSEDELARWKETMDKLKDLIISYCGYTLEDPGMFPQPPG
jgi:hypothetical protein